MSEPAKKKGQAGRKKGQKDGSRPLNAPPRGRPRKNPQEPKDAGIGVPTQTHEGTLYCVSHWPLESCWYASIDNPDDADDEFDFDMDDFTPQDLEKVDRDISDALASEQHLLARFFNILTPDMCKRVQPTKCRSWSTQKAARGPQRRLISVPEKPYVHLPVSRILCLIMLS